LTPVIVARDLTKRFGEYTAVDSLSLEVERGEIFGFLGPNGAGKTTTTRMLAGMIAPTEGYAEVAGFRSDGDVEPLHEAIGLLTESPGFYERFSATENLLYFAGFYDIDGEAQVEKYLLAMGLWDRRGDEVGTYSKGMKQKLALARALLPEPQVLFLDEPTSGLDPESARDVRSLVTKLREEGRTIFLTTHNLEEAESLCDRVGVIKTRLVALDTPSNLRGRIFGRQVVVELESVTDSIVSGIKDLGFVTSVEELGNKLTIEMEEFDRNRPVLVRRIVEKGGSVVSVYERKHSLEEIYITLMDEEREVER
jgi:ABC-2 type transport system ATP-binding protein